MNKRVNVVILCEDQQHFSFAYAFLRKWGIEGRNIKPVIAPPGEGAGEQYVRENFPNELRAFRSKSHDPNQRLIVIIDADAGTVNDKIAGLKKACREHKGEKGNSTPVDFRNSDEKVGVFVPKWKIETWVDYIVNRNSVDENEQYSRSKKEKYSYDKNNEAIKLFAKDCQRNHFPPDASRPNSLQRACEEFETRILSPK